MHRSKEVELIHTLSMLYSFLACILHSTHRSIDRSIAWSIHCWIDYLSRWNTELKPSHPCYAKLLEEIIISYYALRIEGTLHASIVVMELPELPGKKNAWRAQRTPACLRLRRKLLRETFFRTLSHLANLKTFSSRKSTWMVNICYSWQYCYVFQGLIKLLVRVSV